jgi:hypothetical protein
MPCVVAPSDLTRDRVHAHTPVTGEWVVDNPADLDGVVTSIIRG